MSDKSKQIEGCLENRFSLADVHVQNIHRSEEKTGLLQIDFSGVGCRMTVSELRRLCDNIAMAVGGTLYGTVNLDYSGDVVFVEILVELKI